MVRQVGPQPPSIPEGVPEVSDRLAKTINRFVNNFPLNPNNETEVRRIAADTVELLKLSEEALHAP